MLMEKAGAVQGVTAESVARQVYGPDVLYVESDEWEGCVGAVVRLDGGDVEVVDMVIEAHEAKW